MERDKLAKLPSELAAVIEDHMPAAAREISGGSAVTSLAEIGLQLSRDRERKELADALLRGIYADDVVELLKWPDLNKKSDEYAARLISAKRSPLLRFNRVSSANSWERLGSAAFEMQKALVALGQEGRYLLNFKTPGDWSAPYPLANAAYVIALAVKAACADMEQEIGPDAALVGRRDWPAAAVADEARKIWAEEEWFSKPEKYGVAPWLLPEPNTEEERKAKEQRWREYHNHLAGYAPVSEKQDGPGPFGCFLNDVLDQLSVKTKHAASALRSLKDVQNENSIAMQKAIDAAIEEGRSPRITGLTGGGWRVT
jgi:hypothetical protein